MALPTEPHGPGAIETARETARELSRRARGTAAILWSGFLAAAFATMVCFAFIDPKSLGEGHAPEWWGPRLQVYAIGFFFFWMIGLVAAALCWKLSGSGRADE